MDERQDRDLAEQANFYRWLKEKRNREEVNQTRKRLTLEVPEASKYLVPCEQIERGIFIIQF